MTQHQVCVNWQLLVGSMCVCVCVCVREREREKEKEREGGREGGRDHQWPPRPRKSGVKLATSPLKDFSWLWSGTCLVSDEG